MTVVEFRDHHYELDDLLYCRETGENRFAVNGEV